MSEIKIQYRRDEKGSPEKFGILIIDDSLKRTMTFYEEVFGKGSLESRKALEKIEELGKELQNKIREYLGQEIKKKNKEKYKEEHLFDFED